MGEHIARIPNMRNAYKILIEKPKCKRPLRRPTHMRLICDGVDWI